MFRFFWFLIFFSLLFVSACNKDNENNVNGPTISVTADHDGPYHVSEEIIYFLELRTDPSVGIASFEIVREDSIIFEKLDFTGNGSDFTFSYTTTTPDLQVQPFEIVFILTDNNNDEAREVVTIDIEVDFPFFFPDFFPDFYWDLVNNKSVSDPTETNDIFRKIEGIGIDVRITLVSTNETKLYNIEEAVFDYFNANVSLSAITAAVDNTEAQDSIVLYNVLPGTDPIPFQYPIIADIRGSGEYALISYSNIVGSKWGYRKTSEFAGKK